MLTDTLTYKQLDDLLLQLGFTCERVAPRWLRYEHSASDLVIVLAEKEPQAPVRVTDAVSARQHLVEKGLISEAEFEAFFSHQQVREAGGRKR